MIKRNKYLLMFIAYVLFTLVAVHYATAQSFFKGPALIEGVTSTATAAGTTTLTKDSQTNQRFTGVTTQTVVLPDATTLPVGRYFQIENRSTGLVTVQTSGGGALTTVLPNMQKQVLVLTIGSAAGSWDVTNIKIDLGSLSNIVPLSPLLPVKTAADGTLTTGLIDLVTDITGILGVANGGTGLNGSTAANGSLLIGNGTGYSLSTLTATTNQTTVTNGSGTITLGTAQDIATTSSPTFANETISGDITLSNANFDSEKVGDLLAMYSSTGVRSGAVMAVNGGDNTKFDISTGVGYITTYSTPSAPTINRIAIGPFTAQTITNLASADFTWILIDSTGAIVQQTGVPTANQRRTHIVIGRINHSNRTNIVFINTLPDFEFSPVSQFGDLVDSLGPFNISNNVITANGANLSMNKSAGSVFQKSFNYATATDSPHVISTTGLTGFSFAYQNQSGGPGGSTTTIDPTTYDLAGVTTTVPNPAQSATVQRVYLFSSNTLRVQRGQAVYANLAAAVQGFPNESFVVSPLIENFAVLVAYVAIQKNCLSLLDTSCAQIITAGRFGSTATGGGGTTNLQQAYLNSVQPQITVNSTNLGLQVRDASTPIGASLFAVQNNAGSTSYLGVDVNGITATNFVGSGTTGAVRVHNLTTTQKNALTGAAGMIVYDTTLNQMQCYINGAWSQCVQDLQSSDLTLTASDTLAISLTHYQQTWLIQGNAGPITMSTTPFGATDPVNGAEIVLIGNLDANSVTFVVNDAANGIIGYGFTLGKGMVATLKYNATLDRYVVKSISN